MTTLILHHDDCLTHDTPARHPESARRMQAVLSAVTGVPGVELLPAPRATREQIEAAHDPVYWSRLLELDPGRDRIAIDPDTWLSAGSIGASLRGSGGACFAVDQLFAGKADNAFCVTRPPGHHAEGGLAMGFCLSNHVAVAARHALATQELDRVAIVDFDVHHGNGTQAIFEQSPEVMYLSSHQVPLYPGTGMSGETGCGNILNLPLPPGTGGPGFRSAWSRIGLPALRRFQPGLILVSAGFDAHENDPLAQLELLEEDFFWITAELRRCAADLCGGRVVSVLEGGYDLEALASSSLAHVEALLA
jgi:acetoin utilization deacetylase AcuC-like enzyme